ncbi:MAG: glycogen synthase GlgA [Gammaproteobacteria bacterium]|nr:glycogen synthase GlgA [Gammaproteobacteria bacterium]MDH5802294.1 glycogen synthase GlgA [Gammaproteobacteria bacterium]
MSKVLFVASEVQPLIKTGGLADVAGALPAALKQLRDSVRVMLPAYQDILESGIKTKKLASFYLPGTPGEVQLLEACMPQNRVKLILVDYAPAFARRGNPYLQPDGNPWPDNAERFALLCRAVERVALNSAGLDWQPDIVHCNDWQTGLIPALLSRSPMRPGTVFTIHNLAYQGLFSRETFISLGLDEKFWHPFELEFHHQLSFIKGGLVYSDRLTTVSPNYAEEIQTSRFGYGLEGLLSFRQDVLHGIINGIDTDTWNPQTDPLISANYAPDNLVGKRLNKAALQQTMGLPQEQDAFLLGSIGRLVDQKGVDLITEIVPKLLAYPIQLVVLGSGETKYEAALKQLAEKYPQKMAVTLAYNESLAHQIEAGADAFLMPSRFEPCGLNQLYSLRYGTIPIVTRVGGLADTVVDTPKHKRSGFIVNEATPAALLTTTLEALDVFRTTQWKKLIKTAMEQDFSWDNSAAQYHSLYQDIIRARKPKPVKIKKTTTPQHLPAKR